MKALMNAGVFLCMVFAVLFFFVPNIHGADGDDKKSVPASPEKPPQLTLVKGVMCESLKDLEPDNETIIFSVALGSVICFTAFDPVPEKTVVYHNWFKRDQAEKKLKLALKPPKWSSFSKIHIRNMDLGPWRVEITDSEGKIFKILRFSVTE